MEKSFINIPPLQIRKHLLNQLIPNGLLLRGGVIVSRVLEHLSACLQFTALLRTASKREEKKREKERVREAQREKEKLRERREKERERESQRSSEREERKRESEKLREKEKLRESALPHAASRGSSFFLLHPLRAVMRCALHAQAAAAFRCRPACGTWHRQGALVSAGSGSSLAVSCSADFASLFRRMTMDSGGCEPGVNSIPKLVQ